MRTECRSCAAPTQKRPGGRTKAALDLRCGAVLRIRMRQEELASRRRECRFSPKNEPNGCCTQEDVMKDDVRYAGHESSMVQAGRSS